MGLFDLNVFDDYDPADVDTHNSIVCARCGADDLMWDERWLQRTFVLINPDGTDHECPASEADEFEIVE
jgi:hypothetical protein